MHYRYLRKKIATLALAITLGMGSTLQPTVTVLAVTQSQNIVEAGEEQSEPLETAEMQSAEESESGGATVGENFVSAPENARSEGEDYSLADETGGPEKGLSQAGDQFEGEKNKPDTDDQIAGKEKTEKSETADAGETDGEDKTGTPAPEELAEKETGVTNTEGPAEEEAVEPAAAANISGEEKIGSPVSETESAEKKDPEAPEESDVSDENAEEVPVSVPVVQARAFRAPGLPGTGNGSNSVTDVDSLRVQITRGASAVTNTDGTDYVWTADNAAAGHTYAFRVDFARSVTDELPARGLQIRIPKSILKDRNGNPMDKYEMSLPQTTKESTDSESTQEGASVPFAYYEDGDYLVIVNEAGTTQAINSYFEVGYTTTAKTFEYRDYDGTQATPEERNAIGNFFATTDPNPDDEEAVGSKSDIIPVYMDTSARITKTVKGAPTVYKTWDSKWGTKPEDADNYYYQIWEIKSTIDKPTQPYSIRLEDMVVSNANVNVFPYAYRMSGDTYYTLFDPSVSSLNVAAVGGKQEHQTVSGTHIDYVMTRFSNADYENLETYDVTNKITVTVKPEDDIDAESYEISSRDFHWEKPVFGNGPTASAEIAKYGTENWKSSRFRQAWDYASYKLQEFADSDSGDPNAAIGSLKYTIRVNGLPYAWTVDGETDNPENFGKKPVTYQVTDENLYLLKKDSMAFSDSAHMTTEAGDIALESDDYDLNSIDFALSISSAELNSDTQEFDKKARKLGSGDSIRFYVKEKTGEWNTAPDAVYTWGDDGNEGTVEINSEQVKSLSSSRISFADGVDCFRVEVENKEYNTVLDLDPVYTLFATDNVKTVTGTGDSVPTYVTMKNQANLQVFRSEDPESQLFSADRYAGDRIRKIQRDSSLSKKVSTTSNDTRKKSFIMTWQVTQSETETTDNNKNNIKQNGGTFYDLLPKGAVLEASSMQVLTRIDGVDEELASNEYEVNQVPDYQGSGRTLVVIRIIPQGEYYQLTYNTAHSWESLSDYGDYVTNPVAYQTGNDDIASGRADDGGTISDENRRYFVGLDSNNNGAKRFIYVEDAQYVTALKAAMSGLDKQVMAAGDESWSRETTVEQNDRYQYRLRYENSLVSEIRNMVLYDSLENYDPEGDKASTWNGILQSVDVSQLKALGAEPVVYVSEKALDFARTSEDSSLPEATDLSNSEIWTTMDDYLAQHPEERFAAVRSIAVDFRRDSSGNTFTLSRGKSATAVVYMKAPDTMPGNVTVAYPENYNNVYILAGVPGTPTEDHPDPDDVEVYIHQDFTTVKYHQTGRLLIRKVSSEDENLQIQGVVFRLTGKEGTGQGTEISRTTNSLGYASFANLDAGVYTLQETNGVPNYLEDSTEHEVVVSASGTVTMDGQEVGEKGYYVLTNKPRVHGDVKFDKRSTVSKNTGVNGAEFKLTGDSYYGNTILETATSEGGVVVFKNVERGTYTMQEVSAPAGYIKDTSTYTVTVDQNGVTSITPLEKDISGKYIIYNEPYHSFTIAKRSSYDNAVVPDAEYRLYGVSASGTAVDVSSATNTAGEIVFAELESGAYTLEETSAPKGYRLDESKHTVTITKEGVIEVGGETKEGDYFILYDQKIPEGVVVVTKKWIDEDDSERNYPTIHISPLEPDPQSQNGRSGARRKTEDTSLWDSIGDLISSGFQNLQGAADITGSMAMSVIETMMPLEVQAATIDWQNLTGTGSANARWRVVQEGNDNILEFAPQDESKVGIIGGSGRSWQGNINTATATKVRFLGILKIDNMRQFFRSLGNVVEIDLVAKPFGTCTDPSLTLTKGDPYKDYPFEQKTTNMQGAFSDIQYSSFLNSLKTIVGLETLDTSTITTFEKTFFQCRNLTDVDTSQLNTANATTFSSMFQGCNSLKKLDLSSFDTSKATSFANMFATTNNSDGALEELNLSSFTIKEGASVAGMFNGQKNLKKITFGSDVATISGSGLVGPTQTDVYTGLWSKGSPYSAQSCSNDELLAKKGADLAGTWYWQINTSAPDVKSSYESVYADHEGDGLYNVVSAGTSAEGMFTDQGGYWTILDANTWTYTFYVYDANMPWYVWEDDVTGYVGDHTIRSPLQIPDGSSEAVITNTSNQIASRTYGSLLIGKKVYNNPAPDKKDAEIPDAVFKFQIKLENEASPSVYAGTKSLDATVTTPADGSTPASTTISKLVFMDGVANIQLKNNQTYQINQLLTGTTYKVTEEEIQNFTTYVGLTDAEAATQEALEAASDKQMQTASGVIAVDTTAQAEFANIYTEPDPAALETVSLLVSKVVTQETGSVDESIEYPMTVQFLELPDATELTLAMAGGGTTGSHEPGVDGIYRPENGVSTIDFSIANGKTAEIQGIPVGSFYKITEEGGKDYTAKFAITDAMGIGKITRNAGEVTTKNTDLSTDVERADKNEAVTVTFTNHVTKTQKVALTKKVVDRDGTVTDDSSIYEFEVLFSGLPSNAEVKSSRDVFTADISGKARRTYNIGNRETVIFEDLPVGTRYTYIEKENVMISSYTSRLLGTEADIPGTAPVDQANTENKTELAYGTGPVDDGGTSLSVLEQWETGKTTSWPEVIQGQDVEAVYTNTPVGNGSIQVGKQVAGNMGSKLKDFEFVIFMTNNHQPVKGTYKAVRTIAGAEQPAEEIVFQAGQARIWLKHDETLTLQDVPVGFMYTLKEEDYSKDGYSLNAAASVNIKGDANGEFEVKVNAAEGSPNEANISTFVNERNASVDTGLATGRELPQAVGVTAGAALAAGFILMRRRRRRI